MRKSASGLFNNTKGYREHYFENNSPSDIIHHRVSNSNLDTRKHALKYKLLSRKRRSLIANRIKERKATKLEYKHLESNKRLAKRRSEGVSKFWEEERIRVISGTPTRNWSSSQREAIIKGEKPKYKGKTIQGHHTYPVSQYPHLANKHEVVYPSTYREHLYGWHGGNYNKAKPGKQINPIKDF